MIDKPCLEGRQLISAAARDAGSSKASIGIARDSGRFNDTGSESLYAA